MRFARFSIAELLGAVGLSGLGLACLLHASSPWAATMFSITLGLLTMALIGVIYRMGERRAFWVGFAICGWLYMALTTNPWLGAWIGPNLVTSKLLYWAYPRLIPDERQLLVYNSRLQAFQVQRPILGESLAKANLSGRRVDVWVKKEGEKVPSFLLGDVPVGDSSGAGNTVTRATLVSEPDQFARLAQARAEGLTFVLERHHSSPLAPLWSIAPVSSDEFQVVGHSWFGLLWAWIGGCAGRYFYATRDLVP